MSANLLCDVCRSSAGTVLRYTLSRRPAGKNQGRGSIDLCTPCWERIAQPRLRDYVPVPKPAMVGTFGQRLDGSVTPRYPAGTITTPTGETP